MMMMKMIVNPGAYNLSFISRKSFSLLRNQEYRNRLVREKYFPLWSIVKFSPLAALFMILYTTVTLRINVTDAFLVHKRCKSSRNVKTGFQNGEKLSDTFDQSSSLRESSCFTFISSFAEPSRRRYNLYSNLESNFDDNDYEVGIHDENKPKRELCKEDEDEILIYNDITLSQCRELMKVGCEAAYKAGEVILKYRNGAVDVKETKYTDKDLVTEVDGQCQQIIEDYILSQFPANHSFLGEESVLPGAQESIKALDEKLREGEQTNVEGGESSNFLWIIDPIDGTTNFVHGMPLSAVSIACTYKGQVLVGIVYDPYAGGNNINNNIISTASSSEGKNYNRGGEMFTAIKGTGITNLNGQQIVVGKEQTLGEALVAGGCPPKESSQKPAWRGLVRLAPQVRSIRLLGSAAIMLAWIANGRLTAYIEPDLNSWDTAAGFLLIQEAGGVVLDGETGEGYTLRTRSIIAANNDEIAKSLRQELLEVDAVSLDFN